MLVAENTVSVAAEPFKRQWLQAYFILQRTKTAPGEEGQGFILSISPQAYAQFQNSPLTNSAKFLPLLKTRKLLSWKWGKNLQRMLN